MNGFEGSRTGGDREIGDAVLRLTRWNTSVADWITVEVLDGWVTLRGEVDWRYESKDIEGAVQRIPGVRGVRNELSVLERPPIPRAAGRRERHFIARTGRRGAAANAPDP